MVGESGLLPIRLYLDLIESKHGPGGFLLSPSLFWSDSSDQMLLGVALAGLMLSILAVVGRANSIVMFLLWLGYQSYVNVGQIFLGYGWETLLLEVGFLAIFFCPFLSTDLYREKTPPREIVIWLLRWVLFRLMFGAGLIKLRSGDPCWWELTCLIQHYETQPLPNPLSWYIHMMPGWFHKCGVLVNHFVELVVPWFYFFGRRFRSLAGLITIIFQLLLILSGNLSWLNWLTIVVAISCFDDQTLCFGRWKNSVVPARQPLDVAKTFLQSAKIFCLGF